MSRMVKMRVKEGGMRRLFLIELGLTLDLDLLTEGIGLLRLQAASASRRMTSALGTLHF